MALRNCFFRTFLKSLLFVEKKIGQIDPGVAILLIIPALLIVANESWTFNAVSNIDPWIYLGFFLRLKQYLITFDGTYYATRLSWLLPGHIAYSVLPPLLANIVLDLGKFYLSSLSLYFVLKMTVSKRAALFASVLLCFHPFFIANIGWDYVSGIGISYFFLTLFFLTKAVRQNYSWIFLILSGVGIGLTIYTNIFWIAFIPSLITYYFISVSNKSNQIREKLVDILLLVFGFVLVTSVLGAVNYWANGKFAFFMPSFSYANGSINQPNPWKAEWVQVLPTTAWLMTLGFTICFSFISLVFRARIRGFSRSLLTIPAAFNFQFLLLLNFFILVLFEIKGQPVLQVAYYASFLIPSVFLAIGEQFDIFVNTLRRSHFWIFICAFSSFAVVEVSHQVSNTFWKFSEYSILLFFVFCLILLGLWLYFVRQRFKQESIKLSILGMVLVASVTLFTRHWHGGYFTFSTLDCSFACGSSLESVVQVHRFMEQYDPKVQALFWYNVYEDKLEPNRSAFYTGISSTFLWSYRLVNEKFPQIVPDIVDSNGNITPQSANEVSAKRALLRQTLINHQKVAILSRQPNALSQGIEALRGLNLGTRLIAEKTIQAEDLKFNLIVLSIAEKPEPKANSSVQ